MTKLKSLNLPNNTGARVQVQGHVKVEITANGQSYFALRTVEGYKCPIDFDPNKLVSFLDKRVRLRGTYKGGVFKAREVAVAAA